MKALIVSAGLFEDCELLGPYSRLQEEECQVDVAAPERGRIYGKHGYAVEAGKALHEVNPEDYAALILPGGKARSKSAASRRRLPSPKPSSAPASRLPPSATAP